MNQKTEKPSATGTAEGFENQIENLQAQPNTPVNTGATTFRISLFDNKRDATPKPTARTWGEICERVRRPIVRADKDGALFSPAVFNPSRRKKENVTEVSLLVLDYDHAADFDRDTATWRNLKLTFAAYTTHSSYRETESNPKAEERFRVILPLAEPIMAGKFPALWQWAARTSGGKVDTSAKDASRMFYTPATASNDARYRSEIYDGALLDWRALNLESERTEASPASNGGLFADWNALRAELGRRIIAHETAKKNGSGKYDCRGICHGGNGNTGLFYDPENNQAYCNNRCDQAAILRAFGLPEKPEKPAKPAEKGKASEPQNEQQSPPTRNGKPIILSVKRLADVPPETIDWLWFPYLPSGKLTLLEGDPGLGKSWLTCAMATGVAAGQGLPGADLAEPRNVLMLSAEDGLADTIRPRLDSMNADVSRIYALETPVSFDDAGLRAVEGVIAEIEPALVIVDPIVAYLGGDVDLHRANETREVMARLALTAAKFRCAILCVRHLAKGGTNKAIHRGLGSIDIAAAVRSVLLVGADPDQPAKRAIVQIKNNLAAFGAPIGYELKEGALYWTGTSDLTADRILNGYASSEEDSLERRDAEEFLRELLADGEKEAKEVENARKAAGVSDYSLRKAKAALRVKTRKLGGKFSAPGEKTGWAWSLPEGVEDVEKGAEDVDTNSTQRLQANYGDKNSYVNGLAEDVEGVFLPRLQANNPMPSTPSGAGREEFEL